MYRNVYDLKSFYNSREGRLVRRIIGRHVRGIWPDVRGLRLTGCGYAVPYLRMFMEEAERVTAIMPASQGMHPWPAEAHNLVTIAEEAELPLETNSIDRFLLVHSLEHAELLRPNLQEVWRVLKSNGRLLIVVPNRHGLWARAEWSPFGQGTPYTASQLSWFLRDNLFVHERTDPALFVPPVRMSLVLKSAATFEQFGKYVIPALAGVHIVEASKQLYGGLAQEATPRMRIRGRGLFAARPVPVPGESR